jgi:uncharacterized membrane protein
VNEDDQPGIGDANPVSATAARADNSLGRLLTLADGIFAIAMTLLSLDLMVPEGATTNHDLPHYLSHHIDSYLSYLFTFYVVAGYWIRHRRLMRSVVTVHPALIRDTIFLLFLVAAMPFPASLIGQYGSAPISLTLYASVNVLATGTLILMSWDVRRQQLTEHDLADEDDYAHRWRSWLSMGVFGLCIPGSFILGTHALYLLILLAVPDRAIWIIQLTRHVRGRKARKVRS